MPDELNTTITEELRRDEAIEGALRYMVEHPENQEEDMLGWSHIEALIRQIDRLRAESLRDLLVSMAESSHA